MQSRALPYGNPFNRQNEVDPLQFNAADKVSINLGEGRDYLMMLAFVNINTSLICDKSVTTQNLAFLSYCYRKKPLQMHF